MESNAQILIEDLDRCLARLKSRYGDNLLSELHRRREDCHDTLRGKVLDLMIERAEELQQPPTMYCLYDERGRQLPYPPAADVTPLTQKQRELKAQGITTEIKLCC